MRVDQSAGDGSVNVSSDGNVTIIQNAGLSVGDVKDIVHDMMRDALAGLQREALTTAQTRSEEMLEEFLASAERRFDTNLQEKLGGLNDPGAQYALRSAQTDYARYGSEGGKSDAIELLIERLEQERPTTETVVLDEALSRAGRLSDKQVALLCFYVLVFIKRDGKAVNLQTYRVTMREIFRYASCLNITESEISNLASQGLLAQMHGARSWISFYDVMKGNYWGLLLKGAASATGFSLPERSPAGLLVPALRNFLKVQPSHVFRDEWKALVEKALGGDVAAKALEAADANLLSQEEFASSLSGIEGYNPQVFTIFGKVEDAISAYQPTPVGAAIAVARLTRDGCQRGLTISDFV